MIALPPGCTVTYPILILVDKLTQEMIDWHVMVGGEAVDLKTNTYYRTGKEIMRKMVKYGTAKWCHIFQDGTGSVRLNFNGEDAQVACIFLIKFSENVLSHNIKEAVL